MTRKISRLIASLSALCAVIATVAITNTVCLNINLKKARSFPSSGCPELSAENTADGTWNYRYYVLRKQFDGYENSAFSFTWNDPLY